MRLDFVNQLMEFLLAFGVVLPPILKVDDMRPIYSQKLIRNQVERLPPLRKLLVERGQQGAHVTVAEDNGFRQI